MVVTSSFLRTRGFGAALGIAGALLAAPVAQAQGSGPFAGLTGAWAGNGSINMTDGSKESIRCRASYSVPPSAEKLHIELNCASDSYKVQVISNVVADAGGNLSGTWREVTRQAQGDVTGKVQPGGQVQASLGGTGFSAQLSISTRGSRQTVAISSQGTDVQNVNIELHRG